MAFYVGQKVVCVDAEPPPDYSGTSPLREGAVYTINAFYPKGQRLHGYLVIEDGIDVTEAPAPPIRGQSFGAYRATRFRPAVEPSTDISWAHEIVRTVFEKSPELALAARLRGE